MTKITKEEAAKILGAKNVRTVERLVSAGKLRAEYEQGVTRRVPMFDRDEVKRLAEDQRQPVARGVAVDQQPQALAPVPFQMPTIADNGDRDGHRRMSQLVAIVAQAMEEARAKAPALSDLAHKLLLTLPEAAQLSGIPVEHLRDAARAGKLKTVKTVGRGFGKVKREVLNEYVRKL